MKSITDKLKAMKKTDSRLLQARVSKPTYDKLRAKLKQENITIQDFFEASCLAYLDETE